MIRYGRNTVYPTETDSVLGPRTVSLWRTANTDSYLRLAQADTDCPPDPTTLLLDDGVTEPFRYEFFQVNRNPDRENNAPNRTWLIKGRAQTSYLVSARTPTEHWVEFCPYLYVGRVSNPTENNFVDGDSDAPNDGSNYNISPPIVAPVTVADFFPLEMTFVAYYYASALVQEYGSNGYRAGVACIVGVDSLDYPVSVQWYYVLFQNRVCLAAVPIIGTPSWSHAPWVRLRVLSNQLEVYADNQLVITHAGSIGDWSRYTLRGMETLLGNVTNGNPLGSWSYLGGQFWTWYIPVGRVAGVRSAFTTHTVAVPVSDTTPVRIRARTSKAPNQFLVPNVFRTGSTSYNALLYANDYYYPAGNPLGTNWYAEYSCTSTWTQPTLLELTEVEVSQPTPFIVAEWVSSPSGLMGNLAQTRFRVGNSNAPVNIYLRRGSQETLLQTVAAPSGGWDDTVWHFFDWIRLPPRGSFELVYRLADAPDAVLNGTVTVDPQVSLVWLSPSARSVGQPFTVRATAAGSDATLIIETIQGSTVIERASYPPPSAGYWSGETRDTTWTATVPYGNFTVQARLETASATVNGTVLAPTLQAEWVSSPHVLVGATMTVRARVQYTNAPLEFWLRRGSEETLIATYSAPSGGWNNEWQLASWVATLPTGNVEWLIRCDDQEVSLWGTVFEPADNTGEYGYWCSLPTAVPHIYWIIRSPQRAVSARVLPNLLIQLGSGWGLANTHQGRLLEIETYFDT